MCQQTLFPITTSYNVKMVVQVGNWWKLHTNLSTAATNTGNVVSWLFSYAQCTMHTGELDLSAVVGCRFGSGNFGGNLLWHELWFNVFSHKFSLYIRDLWEENSTLNVVSRHAWMLIKKRDVVLFGWLLLSDEIVCCSLPVHSVAYTLNKLAAFTAHTSTHCDTQLTVYSIVCSMKFTSTFMRLSI